MYELSNTNTEALADTAEKADNLAHAANLPLPPLMHVEMLSKGLADIRDTLRLIYRETTGLNPWEH